MRVSKIVLVLVSIDDDDDDDNDDERPRFRLKMKFTLLILPQNAGRTMFCAVCLCHRSRKNVAFVSYGVGLRETESDKFQIQVAQVARP